MIKKFNLTSYVLKHRKITLYITVCLFLAGIYSYLTIGRMENPDFTIRQMYVAVSLPGASVEQMQRLVLDKLEKKLQNTRYLKHLRSYTLAGQSVLLIALRDDCPKPEVKKIWQEIRNHSLESKQDMPTGVNGPFFNDRFDDVFGSIYALTGESFSYAQKLEYAEKIRLAFLTLDSVRRVELAGVQTEKIHIKTDPIKAAGLGITTEQVSQAVLAGNTIVFGGMTDTKSDNIRIDLNSDYTDIGNIPIKTSGGIIKLSEIADITKGYSEPAEPKMYFKNQQAIGITVSMEEGYNIISMGKDLDNIIADFEKILPSGLKIEQVMNQPAVVKNSINEFIRSIFEAVLIIMAVSFLSLGIRAGIVVSLCIPLVFAVVFIFMKITGINLHTVSLGTLIMALGLLVDDETIAIEMMTVKLDEGLSRIESAIAAFHITAVPMLTGTLITCAAFIPIGFAKGLASEFTSAIFPMLTVSLISSWLVSVTLAPLIGYYIMKKSNKTEKTNKLSSKFNIIFNNILEYSLNHRKLVLLLTAVVFIISIYSVKFVRKEFFPPSKRGDLIVDINLPAGSSMKASEELAKKFSSYLDTKTDIINYSYYVGQGSPRFVTSVDPVINAPHIAQFIIIAKDDKSRDILSKDLRLTFNNIFPEATVNIKPLKMGPPSPYPVMLRITGEDSLKVKQIATEVTAIMATDNNFININTDWGTMQRVVRLHINEERLAEMNINRLQLSKILQNKLSGTHIGEYYENNNIIPVIFRQNEVDIAYISSLPVPLLGGSVPLSHIVNIEYASEDAISWRRNLLPTITVQSDVLTGTPNDNTQKAYDITKHIREKLPFGYKIEIAGVLEDSKQSSKNLAAPVPVMLFVIITILLIQLKNFSLVALTLLTAPLGFIGISISMLLTNQPMGFVSQAGIIALVGMLIRNSVILIDQIEVRIAEGFAPRQAIIDSAIMRFRPIMLTTLTAVFAFIPLMSSAFWGPLAVSVSGGLFVGTVLVLVVLPCMYAAWFKIK